MNKVIVGDIRRAGLGVLIAVVLAAGAIIAVLGWTSEAEAVSQPYAVLYSDANFQGSALTITEDMGSLPVELAGKVSSLQLRGGMQAIAVYSMPGYYGLCESFISDESWLGDDKTGHVIHNDLIGSIKVGETCYEQASGEMVINDIKFKVTEDRTTSLVCPWPGYDIKLPNHNLDVGGDQIFMCVDYGPKAAKGSYYTGLVVETYDYDDAHLACAGEGPIWEGWPGQDSQWHEIDNSDINSGLDWVLHKAGDGNWCYQKNEGRAIKDIRFKTPSRPSCQDTFGPLAIIGSDGSDLNYRTEGGHTVVTTCFRFEGTRDLADTAPPTITFLGADFQYSDNTAYAYAEPKLSADAGWNVQPVRLRWSCADSLSGAVEPEITSDIGSQGGNIPIKATCLDAAGNQASDVRYVNNDWTAPSSIMQGWTPDRNSFGWVNTSPVTITVKCVDAMSGPVTELIDKTVSGEGYPHASFRCEDRAGNWSDSEEPAWIDLTAPTVSITTPADGATYMRNSAVSASYVCDDQAELSGVAFCDGTVASGESLDTASSAGGHSFIATATDKAGNRTSRTVSYTVVNPVPVLDGTAPTGAMKGDGSFSLTVSGSDFVPESQVRWDGSDLATSFVSSTELTALIPADRIVAVGVGYVTVFSPAPGGGTSATRPLFVTDTGAGVTAADIGVGVNGTAEASTGSNGITATATGDGTLIVAEYESNPGGTPWFNSSNAFVDVFLGPGHSFTSLTIVDCAMNGGDVVYWWDGSEWVAASHQSYDPNTGCVTVTVNSGTAPSPSELTGTYFAASRLTFDDLCALSKEYSTKDGIDAALCETLAAAEDAAGRNNVRAKMQQLAAYKEQVESQTGKALTADEVTLLKRLADLL